MAVPDVVRGKRVGLYPRLVDVATPLLVERALGAPYLTTRNWLRHYYSWSAERRQEWQQARLAEVLAHATAHVPRYRALAGPDSGLALEDLPIVRKDLIRLDMDAYLSVARPTPPHVLKRTSGTTGESWTYPLDRQAWTHTYAAWLYFLEQAGHRYGEPMLVLGPHGVRQNPGAGVLARLREKAERRHVLPETPDLGRAASELRLEQAARHSRALWYGYPGVIAALARAVLEGGGPTPAPRLDGVRAVVTAGEMLHPLWRRQIEQAFGCRVYDEYGCNDGGILSQSCSAGRYHVAENLSLVEVLEDGRPCRPGVEGAVTVTNLHARVLPFLRYDTGDRASLGVGECPCGQPGQTLQGVRGRTWPSVLLPDGREINSLELSLELIEAPHVRRVQLLQTDVAALRVRLDVDDAFDAEEQERIRAFLDRQCQRALRISICTDEAIELTSAGKHPFVIRRNLLPTTAELSSPL